MIYTFCGITFWCLSIYHFSQQTNWTIRVNKPTIIKKNKKHRTLITGIPKRNVKNITQILLRKFMEPESETKHLKSIQYAQHVFYWTDRDIYQLQRSWLILKFKRNLSYLTKLGLSFHSFLLLRKDTHWKSILNYLFFRFKIVKRLFFADSISKVGTSKIFWWVLADLPFSSLNRQVFRQR